MLPRNRLRPDRQSSARQSERIGVVLRRRRRYLRRSSIGRMLHTNPAPATNAILFGPETLFLTAFPGRTRFWLWLAMPARSPWRSMRRSSRPCSGVSTILSISARKYSAASPRPSLRSSALLKRDNSRHSGGTCRKTRTSATALGCRAPSPGHEHARLEAVCTEGRSKRLLGRMGERKLEIDVQVRGRRRRSRRLSRLSLEG